MKPGSVVLAAPAGPGGQRRPPPPATVRLSQVTTESLSFESRVAEVTAPQAGVPPAGRGFTLPGIPVTSLSLRPGRAQHRGTGTERLWAQSQWPWYCVTSHSDSDPAAGAAAAQARA